MENSVPQRKCTKCKEIKPATSEYFHKDSTREEKIRGICKVCANDAKRKHPIVTKGYKRCSKCKEVKLANVNFAKNAARGDGLHHYCLECSKIVKRERYYKDHEQSKLKNRLYYVVMKDRVNERDRLYHARHRTERNERHRKYHAANRERFTLYHRGYVERNKEKIREIRRRAHINRRARKSGTPGIVTKTQIQEQLKRQKFRCYYAACGFAKFEKRNGKYVFHVDHTIPVSRTELQPRNDISHLVLACPACNIQKNNKAPWEWPEGGRLF